MSDIKKKIALFGFTSVALEIGFHLREKGYDFFIVDNDPAHLEKAEEYKFDLRIFDYTDDDLLHKAGLGNGVELIYGLFFEDSKNIFLTISARALDPELTIVSITQTHDSIHKLKAAGADTIIDPYQISGKKIYEMIKKPQIVHLVDDIVFGREDINIEQMEITQDSPLNGLNVDAVNEKGEYNLIVLGVLDKELKESFIFIGEGMKHILDAGDILVVTGTVAEISRFRKDFAL